MWKRNDSIIVMNDADLSDRQPLTVQFYSAIAPHLNAKPIVQNREIEMMAR